MNLAGWHAINVFSAVGRVRFTSHAHTVATRAQVSHKIKMTKKCCMRRCRNDTASPRAKFCTECFKKNAGSSSLKRKLCGGNSTAKGVTGNKGNAKVGNQKRKAGKRSGVKRRAKHALVVKKDWPDSSCFGPSDSAFSCCQSLGPAPFC